MFHEACHPPMVRQPDVLPMRGSAMPACDPAAGCSSASACAADVPLVTEAARPPAVLEYEIVNTYPHDRGAFTQGLIFRDGFLYESTGLNGRSSLRKVVARDRRSRAARNRRQQSISPKA